jgi:hypothetical protein
MNAVIADNPMRARTIGPQHKQMISTIEYANFIPRLGAIDHPAETPFF